MLLHPHITRSNTNKKSKVEWIESGSIFFYIEAGSILIDRWTNLFENSIRWAPVYVCMYIHILTVKQQIWSRCCSSSHRRGALTGKLRVEKKAEDIHNWCQAKLNFPLRGIKGNPISPFYSSTSRAMSRLSSLLASSSAQEQLLCVFYSSAAAAAYLLLLFPA